MALRVRLSLVMACVLCVACRRDQVVSREHPAWGASVVTLGVAPGTCSDVLACQAECDAGSADRCRRLAETYASGRGVARDETRATALYEHACEMRDPPACVFAGRMYEFAHGVAEDDFRAARLYARACDLQWAPGCYNLAVMCERGTGVPQDRAKAASLYQVACSAGAKPACDKADEMRETPARSPKTGPW